MISRHGGNIGAVVDKYKIPEAKIIDFSSNVNPLGMSPGIRRTIKDGIDSLKQYPDPDCTFARVAISKYWGIEADNILLGNGSNELIHLAPRALGSKRVLICQPAFSEYELSVKASGAKPYFIFSKEKDDFSLDLKQIAAYAKKADMIMLCNPNNPTGNLFKKESLLSLAYACKKNKAYLFVDEVFMDLVDREHEYSLLQDAIKQKYILILRSFTKFFCLPGLRVGYMVAAKETLKRISSFQPSWSVNSLAQLAVRSGLDDGYFINSTKRHIRKEKSFMFNKLKGIKAIKAYYPNANFIFCKTLNKSISSKELFSRLIKSGILIRDCSNFRGLNKSFFRIAIRNRKDNCYLIECLKKIF